MQTKAGDPGAFAHFDLSRVDSPAFVVDAAKLRANCRVLADVRDAAAADGADIKVFAALKAFSMWSAAPIIGEYLDGVSTSGLWEARLASEFYDGEIATYSAAFKPEELEEICRLSDHVIFNSPFQHERARLILEHAAANGANVSVGLRINPQVPTGEVAKYDPSAPGSRLGFPLDQLTEEHMEGVEGIHFHNLCEQDFEPLRRTWDVAFDYLEPYFGQFKWINLGGGHHITRSDYQRDELVAFLKDLQEDTQAEVYLEPGEAIALDPGYTYNPKVNFQQGNNTKVLSIPPGPNGPVGTVWLALSKPTYGIHGTPEPSKIGRTQSHGCIRLTNWDATELAKMVKAGVTVEFVE